MTMTADQIERLTGDIIELIIQRTNVDEEQSNELWAMVYDMLYEYFS